MAVRAKLAEGATRSKDQFLSELKEVKNNLIGNVGKKLALVQEDGTVAFMVEQIRETAAGLRESSTATPTLPVKETMVKLEILNELAVILGAVANAGSPALVELLRANLAIMLLASLSIVHPLAQSSRQTVPSISRYIDTKCLPSIARALRNHTVALGDFVWGHMWGVGVEIKTDPINPEGLAGGATTSKSKAGIVGSAKGKGVELDDMDVDLGVQTEVDLSRVDNVQQQAIEVLTGIFKPRSLEIFTPILLSTDSPLTLLPLYQMLAHLTVMSWQRNALINASIPFHKPVPMGVRSRSAVAFRDDEEGKEWYSARPLLVKLTDVVMDAETNVKLKQAALDLLGALCKDNEDIAGEAMWLLDVNEDESEWGKSPDYYAATSTKSSTPSRKTVAPVFDELVGSRSNGIAVSAACCAAQMLFSIPADSMKGGRKYKDGMALFKLLVHLLDQTIEDKIRICFVISHLLADDMDLQRQACDTSAMSKVIAIIKELDTDAYKGETESNKARLLEAGLLAMTSLGFYHESPKSQIADAGMLQITKKALSHPSYGVRAAACQVTRALSRSTAILRTTLVDSGIADRILELLQEEEKKVSKQQLEADDFANAGRDGRRDTVMIAASAALCNLITEFSPMQIVRPTHFPAERETTLTTWIDYTQSMIDKGGIDLLVRMCDSPSQATRMNALWSFRNMLYKNEFKVKVRVMEALTWPTLHRHIEDPSHELQEQGLALLRNICCEGSEEEIELVFNGFGEAPLFDVIEKKLAASDPDCLEQLMFVLYNICLGSEKHREAVLSRPEVCKGMMKALSSDSPLIKIPAIGCFANLVETNDRHRRPRQDVIARLKPYMIETQLRVLITDATFDIRDKASRLLNCLEAPGGGSR